MKALLQGLPFLFLLVVCAGCAGESESEEREVGFRGLAARNPFLGAQRLAEELGYEARGTTHLTSLPGRDWTLLLRPGVMTGGVDQADDLLEWVSGGGDLWVDLEDYILEEEEEPGVVEDGPPQWALYTLLEELKLDVVYNEGDEWGEEGNHGLESAPHLTIPWPEADLVLGYNGSMAAESWGERSHSAMMHLRWGKGHVRFFASLEGFDNHHLRDHNWAEVYEHLLAQSHDDVHTGGVLVVYGGARSFLHLLWQHAWYFLLAMGVLLALWLWRASRRFGPVLEDPAWDPDGVGIGGGREFVEHLVAAGQTYERRGQLPLLLDAAWSRARGQYLEGDPAGQAIERPGVQNPSPTGFLKKIQSLQTAARRGSAGHRTPTSNPEIDHDE